MGRILLVLAGFLVVGVPIVAVLWHAVNDVAAGNLGSLLLVLPMLVLFVAFLFLFGRQMRRLDPRS